MNVLPRLACSGVHYFKSCQERVLVREHRTNEKLSDLLHLDLKSDTAES